MDATLARSLVAEAIGTFTPVFAGCGAIMVMIYAVGRTEQAVQKAA